MIPEGAAQGRAAERQPSRARGSRLVLLAILGFPVLLFVAAGLRAVELAREGEVPAALRDLDCDGKVSFAEWLRGGIDFRLRPSELVPGCQDVFAVKTGRAIVVRCPIDPQCRLARDLLR
jgi:hypothetical protein